ncbi:hypothetical protein QBC37DRAFT_450023 [Rhypophila decipiens]|uniref:Uncharacterized protein n=1 Tax=Rhypophila decipiens TaxID=261697 RepID=A0AAN7B3J6_9PEZI|nr:hypothetical protein QBC37DRAFT_450023 [Rhypophila decipiens]
MVCRHRHFIVDTRCFTKPPGRFSPLCKVSRQFNLVATPFLYKHFRLDARVPTNMRDLESCQRSVVRVLGSYLTVLQSNRNLDEHCQSLELILNHLSLNDAMRDALDQVLRQMPNLKRLRLCLSHVWGLCQWWDSYSGVAGAESGLVQLLLPYMPQMEELSLEITTKSWPQLIPPETRARITESPREWLPPLDSISRVRASPAGELLALLEHAPRLEALQIVDLLSKSAWQNVDSRLGLQLSASQNAIFSNMKSLSLSSYWAGDDHHLWPVLRNIKNLQHFAIDFGNGSSLGDVEKRVAVFSAGFWDLLLLHKKSLRSLALLCTGLDLDWWNELRKPSPGPDWSPYAPFADFEALEELTLALHGPYSLADPVRVRSHAPPRLKRLLLSFWRPDSKFGFLEESRVRFGSGRLSLVSMFIDAARNTGLKEAIIEGIMSENSNQKECARLISQWRQWGVKTTFFDPETCEITVGRVPRPRPIPDDHLMPLRFRHFRVFYGL